jgi:glycosyltransferase involved in cell wall biosynthesis
MKIIFLTISLELGGSERRAITLAKYFKRQGADVELWGFSGPGVLSQLCQEAHIPWKVAPFNWYQSSRNRLVNLLNLLSMLRKANPDVLLPHTLIPNMVCGLIWRWSGVRKCIGYEGGYEFGLIDRNWEKFAVRQLSSIICNAHHLAQAMAGYYALAQNKVQIIHNGVELPPPVHSPPWWRRKLGVSEDAFLAIMVANLSAFKDHETLIRAWRLVLDQLPQHERNAKLLLAGKDFGTELILKRLADELGLQEDVLFLGQVDDISGLLQSVDLGVYSSRSEGSPNGILECMQAGLAVAATDLAGIREIFGEYQYPWLAALDDIKQFAKNILDLKQDLIMRNKIGSYNKARVTKEYSLEKMCKITEAVVTR